MVNTQPARPRAVNRNGPTWATKTASTGWLVLLVLSVLAALNHVLGVFSVATSEDEQLAFAMSAGVNAYAVAVLLFPYRRHEGWAWLVTWLQVAAFASVLPLIGGGLGLGYLVVASIAGLAQLATLPEFRLRPTRQRLDERRTAVSASG